MNFQKTFAMFLRFSRSLANHENQNRNIKINR